MKVDKLIHKQMLIELIECSTIPGKSLEEVSILLTSIKNATLSDGSSDAHQEMFESR